jgi:hypothetical protein
MFESMRFITVTSSGSGTGRLRCNVNAKNGSFNPSIAAFEFLNGGFDVCVSECKTAFALKPSNQKDRKKARRGVVRALGITENKTFELTECNGMLCAKVN